MTKVWGYSMKHPVTFEASYSVGGIKLVIIDSGYRAKLLNEHYEREVALSRSEALTLAAEIRKAVVRPRKT